MDLVSARRLVRHTLATGMVAGALVIPAQSASAAAPSITLEVSCDQATQRTSVQAHGHGYTPNRIYSVEFHVAPTYHRVGEPFGWTAYDSIPEGRKQVTVAADGTWNVPFSWGYPDIRSPADYLYFSHTPSVVTRSYEITSTVGTSCVFIDRD
jgi:hypothetical protein